jgi:uncharacterized protein (TIGR02145 family)
MKKIISIIIGVLFVSSCFSQTVTLPPYYGVANSGFICGVSKVVDADGNAYSTVKIGDQCWMAENLRYLPNVVGPDVKSTSEPCYYVHGYMGTDINEAKQQGTYLVYGVLYNWPAAMVSCPTGWHLPSDDELKQLELSIGMPASMINLTGWRGTNEASKLAGNSNLWNSGPLKSDSEFGTSNFNAIPAGFFNGYFDNFYAPGANSVIPSSTASSEYNIFCREVASHKTQLSRSNSLIKSHGVPVRCVKD